MRLEYINPDIPITKTPEYPGKYYEELFPRPLISQKGPALQSMP